LFVSTAAELFGTNLRATVTTTVAELRARLVPLLTLAFKGLIDRLGVRWRALAVAPAPRGSLSWGWCWCPNVGKDSTITRATSRRSRPLGCR